MTPSVTFAFRLAAGWLDRACDHFSRRGAQAQGVGHLELEVRPGRWVSSFVDSMGPQDYGYTFRDGPQFVDRPHPAAEWILMTYPVTQDQQDVLWETATRLVFEMYDDAGRFRGHHGYDRWGVARFVIPTIDQDPWAYFCSETCVEIAQSIGWFPGCDPWRMSPNHVLGYLRCNLSSCSVSI